MKKAVILVAFVIFISLVSASLQDKLLYYYPFDDFSYEGLLDDIRVWDNLLPDYFLYKTCYIYKYPYTDYQECYIYVNTIKYFYIEGKGGPFND